MKGKIIYLFAGIVSMAIILFIFSKRRIINIIGNLKFQGVYPKRNLSQIRYIVIHHTATSPEASPEYINQLHLDRGWAKIGYHYLVYPDGKIYQVNKDDTVSNHVEGSNTASLGIAAIGNYSQQSPTLSLYASLRYLSRKKARQYNAIIKGHGEFKQTQCPGSIDLQKII